MQDRTLSLPLIFSKKLVVVGVGKLADKLSVFFRVVIYSASADVWVRHGLGSRAM
jgi:hypothetical protein